MARTALFWLLFFPAVCFAGDWCAYKDTNRLIWDKDFKKAITKFFGKEKASFYWPNGSLVEQARDGLSGPQDMIREIAPGLAMASACRAHSCTEKSAAVIACPSEISAIAFFHFNCTEDTCDKDATVTIFYSENNPERKGELELEPV